MTLNLTRPAGQVLAVSELDLISRGEKDLTGIFEFELSTAELSNFETYMQASSQLFCDFRLLLAGRAKPLLWHCFLNIGLTDSLNYAWIRLKSRWEVFEKASAFFEQIFSIPLPALSIQLEEEAVNELIECLQMPRELSSIELVHRFDIENSSRNSENLLELIG